LTEPPGHDLPGKISDRIRAGQVPADLKFKGTDGDPPPSPTAIRNAAGLGLGRGATRARSGETGAPTMRQAHQAAVDAAIGKMNEIILLLAHTKEETDTALGMIGGATGGDVNSVESATNAYTGAALLTENIDTLIGQATLVRSELERYRGGF
jgi:hypothetical protein